MKPIIAFNTIFMQFCKHTNELLKVEYDINAGAAATVYVQVFDFPTPVDLAAGTAAPANTSVPLKSWPVPAGATNGYKEFKNGEMSFSYGVFVCVSTTQATLTIGTGNNKFDSVAAELYNPVVAASEFQTIDVGTQIWANPETHTLIRAAVTNLEAGIRYLMLFASDGPSLGDKPIRQWTLAATGDGGGKDTIELDFSGGEVSVSGIIPMAQTSGKVNQTGCWFSLSTTTKTFTPAVGAGMNIYAEYK